MRTARPKANSTACRGGAGPRGGGTWTKRSPTCDAGPPRAPPRTGSTKQSATSWSSREYRTAAAGPKAERRRVHRHVRHDTERGVRCARGEVQAEPFVVARDRQLLPERPHHRRGSSSVDVVEDLGRHSEAAQQRAGRRAERGRTAQQGLQHLDGNRRLHAQSRPTGRRDSPQDVRSLPAARASPVNAKWNGSDSPPPRPVHAYNWRMGIVLKSERELAKMCGQQGCIVRAVIDAVEAACVPRVTTTRS